MNNQVTPASTWHFGRRLQLAVTRRVKALLGWIIFASGSYRRWFGNQAVIVLFHRIDDRYAADVITRSPAQFERYIRFFRRFFDVVTMSELLDRLQSGRGLAGKLVITFDDGYRGCATAAAPIMERYGVRGCFFLATSFIGTDLVAWWDRQSEIQSEWMSWDQVRQLRQSGHEIGAHTETHADLGITVGEEARLEIESGRARLEREIGEPITLFAYPYGAREQLTAINRVLVREAGFRCCLSAFGGTVREGDDPLDLNRTAISPWYLSPYQFGFELVTGRVGDRKP